MFRQVKINKLLLRNFLFCIFILFSCDFVEFKKELININVKVINSQTREPRIGDTIIVRKVKKPWTTMWQYIDVAEGVTDSLGIVVFTIDKNKRHSFVAYGLYSEYGSTEFAEHELKENDTIIIRVTPIHKRKYKI
jgi:hypothetical protein